MGLPVSYFASYGNLMTNMGSGAFGLSDDSRRGGSSFGQSIRPARLDYPDPDDPKQTKHLEGSLITQATPGGGVMYLFRDKATGRMYPIDETHYDRVKSRDGNRLLIRDAARAERRQQLEQKRYDTSKATKKKIHSPPSPPISLDSAVRNTPLPDGAQSDEGGGVPSALSNGDWIDVELCVEGTTSTYRLWGYLA